MDAETVKAALKENEPKNDQEQKQEAEKEKEEKDAEKESESAEVEKVDFKVIYNKKKYDVSFALDGDIGALKAHLQPIIDIPPAMMKVMIKGLAKDEMTLRKLGVSKGSKVMVVGSSLQDVLSVSSHPSKQQQQQGKDEASSGNNAGSNSICKQRVHKKVLDKGKPDDAMVGFLGTKESLPPAPLSGIPRAVQ